MCTVVYINRGFFVLIKHFYNTVLNQNVFFQKDRHTIILLATSMGKVLNYAGKIYIEWVSYRQSIMSRAIYRLLSVIYQRK